MLTALQNLYIDDWYVAYAEQTEEAVSALILGAELPLYVELLLPHGHAAWEASLGLERPRAFYSASELLRTERDTWRRLIMQLLREGSSEPDGIQVLCTMVAGTPTVVLRAGWGSGATKSPPYGLPRPPSAPQPCMLRAHAMELSSQ